VVVDWFNCVGTEAYSQSSLNTLINIRIRSVTELTDPPNSHEHSMQMAERPTQTRVRAMKIKNYVFRRMTPCSLFKIYRTIPKPPAMMTHSMGHAISARFISLSRQCLCLLLLTSLLGRSADVRELCNRLAGVPLLQREGESNFAREKEDPEAEMNCTTTRRNSSSSSNTVIYFQVCLQLIISQREEIMKFGYWQLWVKISRQTSKRIHMQIKT